MKLTADTPPNGDFARYLDVLESQSPAYQMLRQSGRNDEVLRSLPGMTPPVQRHVVLAEARPVSVDAHFGRGAAAAPVRHAVDSASQTLASLRASPLLQQPQVRALAAPLLQRLEQALAAAARRVDHAAKKN